MKNPLTNFKRLIFAVSVLTLTIDVAGQSDSISVIQKIKQADSLMSKDFPKGMKLCLELNELLASPVNTSYRHRLYILIGKAYWINGEYRKGVEFLKQGKKLAEQAQDSIRWANAANM